MGLTSETEKIMKDKKLYKQLMNARKKGSKTSLYKPLMASLKQQIEKNSVFMYPDKTAYMMNETVQVISVDFVLGLLVDYEKEEENIRGALAETVTKLVAKIEYLERENLNMREVKKESVCIPKKTTPSIL